MRPHPARARSPARRVEPDLQRYSFPGKRREPAWRPVTPRVRRALPTEIASWLIETDSLTQRLRDACGRAFRVALRGQRWERPERSECALLGLHYRARALVRQVHLHCAGRPLVFARTVMPASTLQGPRRRFANLGTRPLGELLFSRRGIVRCGIEVARIESGARLHAAAFKGAADADARGRIWGRRSVFLIDGHPLLVSEIFLPGIGCIEEAPRAHRRAR